MHLVLASASPRRRDLLSSYGYQFTVVPPAIGEAQPPHLSPGETVLLNARWKACAVARAHPAEIVLSADTLVAFEGRLFGKPRDLEDARAMLRELNGRAHEVYSAIWLVREAARQARGAIEISRVQFRRLSDAQIAAYLERINPLDKAGAYAAQDDKGELIDRVEGSLSNVIGLPMEALKQALRAFA